MSELSHVDEAGEVRMVDVGAKPLSRRRAIAQATVRMAPETARRLRELPKGDALATAKLAGIMAAKRTSELIPLCHPLPLTHVEVEIEVAADGVEIVASAETTAQTGVEMEALAAASVAALTVYDMAKAIDKEMEIAEVRLLEKTKEPVVRAAVLTVSDGVAEGTREDESGDAARGAALGRGLRGRAPHRSRRPRRRRRGDRRAGGGGGGRPDHGRHRPRRRAT